MPSFPKMSACRCESRIFTEVLTISLIPQSVNLTLLHHLTLHQPLYHSGEHSSCLLLVCVTIHSALIFPSILNARDRNLHADTLDHVLQHLCLSVLLHKARQHFSQEHQTNLPSLPIPIRVRHPLLPPLAAITPQTWLNHQTLLLVHLHHLPVPLE